eukprot:TRINITY_DN1326_c5_g1_i1.p1 TRINITY_DN1326_c5_g1~~TRINITY_DN1326_c5_g1_i1.p1  ORF type:complete len:2016 (+),score=310.94 TRINITY_DN1326_c5_g1_i1:80-6127(+)
MVLFRLLLLAAAVTMCTGQCAFNAVSVYVGSTIYTGLTVGGSGVTITENSGMVVGNCAIHLTVGDGDSCKFSDPNYANDVVASCSMGVFSYAPATRVMTPNPCPAANTGNASAVGVHLYQETMAYSCAAFTDTSCSVYPCEANCASPGVVTPAVDCYNHCPLGVQTGLLITTSLTGATGEDCSGTKIAVGPYSPTCAVSVVPGYSCGTVPTTVSCAVSQLTNLITNTCTENLCTPLASIPIAGVIGDPSSGDQCPSMSLLLSVISDPSCDIMCDQSAGYLAQTGTYQCGSPMDLSAGQALVSSISACVPVPCPANSSPVTLGVCSCDTGYTGVITYTGVAYSGTCVLIDCDPYVLPSDFVTGDTDGCVGGDILNVNDPTCNVKCAPGYIASTGVVTCDYIGTQKSTTPLTCTEKTCSPYSFGVGITSGVSSGCVAPQTLRQVTQPSCTLSCLPGYTGADGTLDCPTSLGDGSAPNVNIACVENTCAAYVLQTGEVAVSPGCGSLGTVTGNTCTINCDTGYTVGTGTVTCPSNAINGQVPTLTVDPDCRATCALHACGVGYKPKMILSTVCNVMTGCDDITCCDPALCPTNSVTTHTEPMTSSCACLSGYTGTPNWDSSGLAWIHSCVAHCANSFFPGCDPSSMTAKPSPASLPCTGPGNCDSMGCTACLSTDCCDANICTPPGSSFPQYTFSGPMGTSCNTVLDCQPVTCSTGYVGTPVLQCPTPGGMFSFSSTCTAALCPANSGPAGVCACNSGYRVTGGGLPTWDSMSGSWTHTCEVTCSLYTGCAVPGYDLIPSPETVACPGSSGDPAVDCNTATCCVETCDNSGFACPSIGFSLRANPSTIKCPVSGCDQATCCLAMCDHPGFSCAAAGSFIDKPNQDSIACGDNTLASCTTSLCCLATSCSSVTCPAGTHDKSPVPVCTVCTESICCEENNCLALTMGQLPEYMVAGGSACTTVSSCNPTGCSAGYHPDPVAQLMCATNGGVFTATGCSENVCQSGSVANYLTSTSPCDSKTTCGSVTCAVGYNDGGSTPAVDCPTHGGLLVGSGCQENVCTPPGSDGIPGVTFTGPQSCNTVTSCGSIACARGYTPTGTPEISCLVAGGAFTQTGCLSKTCKSPLSNPVDGYSVTIPSCVRTEQCGSVVCNIGYYAVSTPSIVCPIANGDFEYSGCDRVPCPDNASGLQCICDSGFDGTPNWDAGSNNWTHVCTATACPANAAPPGNCTCNVGYSGTPNWSGTAWTHTCSLVPCPSNSSGSLCQCDAGYTGNPSWSVSLQAWVHVCTLGGSCGLNEYYDTNTSSCRCITGYRRSGSVCTVAPCPSGASPPGVCVCQAGGGAPTWDDINGMWTHTCSNGVCGSNAYFDTSSGFCECSDGYTGMVNGVGTCTAVSCPVGASPLGICSCPSNSPPRVWDSVNDRWIHSCVSCGANAYYDNSAGFCKCHIGYTGMVGGVGTCLAVSCPTGASPVGVCNCPGGTPPPVWSDAAQRWTHVCGSGNIPPTVTVPNPVVNTPFGTITVTLPSFLTGISGPEVTQIVTITCTSTSPSLFAIQPNFQIVGTTATLQFTRLGTSVGTAKVSCQATDNGTPSLSTPFTFDINLLSNGGNLKCGYPSVTCVLLQQQITVSVDSQRTVAGYVTNLDPSSQTTCAEQGTSYLRQQPIIASDGSLSFYSGSIQGTTTVICTSIAAGQTTGSVYSFTVNVVGVSDKWLRARVSTTLGAFSEASFVKATIDILHRAGTIKVQGIAVKYGCPMSACPGAAGDTIDRLQCPNTHSGRVAAGCRAVFLESRRGEVLQSPLDVIVDFDIITDQVDGSAAKMGERETAAHTLNNAISQCVSSNTQCDYTQNGVPITPTTNVVLATSVPQIPLTPFPATSTPQPPTESDDTPWWIWLLIGLGILLCCCLLVLAYLFMKRKEKKEKQREQDNEPRRIVFARTHGAESSYYSNGSYGSSYVPSESYSSGTDLFGKGELVMAQYIDGAEYEGEVIGRSSDGTYNIKWYDGTHSEGVPGRQITRIEH